MSVLIEAHIWIFQVCAFLRIVTACSEVLEMEGGEML